MPVHRGNLSRVINKAWTRTKDSRADEGERGNRNRTRSRHGFRVGESV